MRRPEEGTGETELLAAFVKTESHWGTDCPSGNHAWVGSWPSGFLSVSEADCLRLHQDPDSSLHADMETNKTEGILNFCCRCFPNVLFFFYVYDFLSVRNL